MPQTSGQRAVRVGDASRQGDAVVNLMSGERVRRRHSGTTVALSRYEHMVSDFAGWLASLLRLLKDIGAVGDDARLARALLPKFKDGFVADGRHRHALTPGANMAMLPRASLAHLRAAPRVVGALTRLGYTAESPWPDRVGPSVTHRT